MRNDEFFTLTLGTRCPKGHTLGSKTVAGLNWLKKYKRCSTCGSELTTGNLRFSCRLCKYHLCNGCHQQYVAKDRARAAFVEAINKDRATVWVSDIPKIFDETTGQLRDARPSDPGRPKADSNDDVAVFLDGDHDLELLELKIPCSEEVDELRKAFVAEHNISPLFWDSYTYDSEGNMIAPDKEIDPIYPIRVVYRQKDRAVVLEVVKTKGLTLESADPQLRRDRDVVLEAVKSVGGALQYADPELRKDREIVLEAVKNDWYALKHADSALLRDHSFVYEVLQFAEP